MSDIHVAILAAGKGTRMKSALPKVLHRAAGEPLISHVLRAAEALHPATITVVVGHMADAVRAALAKRMGLAFALQEPQLGTGHALLQVEPHLARASGTLVLLSGDVPLLRGDTLRALVGRHQETGAAATVLTARVPAPRGYGRIIRDRAGNIASIVEEKTPRKMNAASMRSTAGSMRSTSHRSSTRFAPSGRRTPRANTISRISSAFTAPAACASRPSVWRMRER
jgi:bifunctional N-acetylglucosamine-1-phosphate-uridyltransferase/glucosamine-1-phosphate-acetyltransferase GlmU-like protein